VNCSYFLNKQTTRIHFSNLSHKILLTLKISSGEYRTTVAVSYVSVEVSQAKKAKRSYVYFHTLNFEYLNKELLVYTLQGQHECASLGPGLRPLKPESNDR
jgi:hypothetical protein